MLESFKAIAVREDEAKKVHYDVETISLEDLDQGDVVVKVDYSSLNYKDMLATQTKGGVIRTYPMIPGIDLSGTVVKSASDAFQKGQEIIITGMDMGVSHTGGLAEYARVPHEWLVPIEDALTTRQAMVYGTAGFTAAQAIIALERHGMTADKQPRVLVTGASGGVGSVALAILHKAGFNNVTALIRKDYQENLVKKLGANHILWADDIGDKRPLASQRFDYILDTVGGEVAATLIPQIQAFGSMALCGNAAGIQLETTVLPLILRGVNLLGINSVFENGPERREIWRRLANEWKVVDQLAVNEVALEEVKQVIESLKEGSHTGRTIVRLSE
ncbi:YhdH/YhfP family quinone oxidoreductase [Aerococcaceae bacterium WGS1372]